MCVSFLKINNTENFPLIGDDLSQSSTPPMIHNSLSAKFGNTAVSLVACISGGRVHGTGLTGLGSPGRT